LCRWVLLTDGIHRVDRVVLPQPHQRLANPS
jgi:hypothetical protein